MHFSILVYIFYQIFDSVHGGGRIYGGDRIDITDAPYMAHSVYLLENGLITLNCGGSILSKNLILLAAHCTEDGETGVQRKADRYTIRVGSTYSNKGGQSHKVKKVFTHPQYAGASDHYHHDVGLLQLKDEIQYGDSVQPTMLVYADDNIDVGADTFVNGWGKNPDHPDDKNHLYQVHLRVISEKQCARDFSDSWAGIGKHEICVQATKKSSCQGDSGGPLIYSKTGRQIGIVSYGKTNCTLSYPSVFVKVQDNLDFINNVRRRTGNR